MSQEQLRRNPGRPREGDPIDLTHAHDLTLPLIERLRCPEGKKQAFLRDSKCEGLRVRVTATGAKAFVFERWMNGATMRTTIGPAPGAGVKEARKAADVLRGQVSAGHDPRLVKRQRAQAAAAQRAADATERKRDALTVQEAWDAYVADRKAATKDGKPRWGALHIRDHERAVAAGGVKASRGTRGRGETIAGPLHRLIALKLRELTPDRIREWAAAETQTRPTVAARAWRLLRGFLSWCAEQPQYADVLPPKNPANTKSVREALTTPKPKRDSLQRQQLVAWFQGVRSLTHTTAAAYLQMLLLTGARPGEVLGLRWSDVNQQAGAITMRDKVDGMRVIPLTPYVAHLLAGLPQVNEWVFASPADDERLKHKPMSKPHNAHRTACVMAGIEGLTLHGLRRSFSTLTEWLDVPAGIVATLMGHKPSATAEKHYKPRPLDMLAMHHQRIEAWILEQAGIPDSEWKPQPERAAAGPMAQGRKLRRVK
jgi:integrase